MLALHILLTLLGAALVAATLPLALELLILSIAALLPKNPASTPAAHTLRLAVIVPAHNEARSIAACVTSLRLNSARDVDIYVIAHNCSDNTAETAAAAGAHVLPLNDDGSGGKGSALHFGFTQALAAGADATLVIDADSVVSPGLTRAVAAALAAGAGAVQCRYIVANAEATPRTRLMALAFLGMNVLRPLGRSRLGLSCGIFGNGFALSAATLRRVPYMAHSVVEDLEYHLHLVRVGIRVQFLDGATVLGEMPDNTAASSTQRARWEGGRILMRRRFSLPLAADVLRGRFRFAEPLLDLLSLPLGTEAVLLAVALLPPLVWLRVYAASGLLTIVLYVLVSASLGPQPLETLKAVAAVPKFLVFKLANRGRTRAAAKTEAAWVRTERNESPNEHTDTDRRR